MFIMNKLYDNFKKYWKNYLIILLLLVIVLGGYLNPFSVNTKGFMSSDSMMMATESSRGVASSSYFPPFYGDSVAPDAQERKITRNANLGLETDRFDSSRSSIINTFKAYDSIIMSESESRNQWNNIRSLNVNARIESDKLDALLEDLKQYGEITSLNVYSNDVTATYINYEERLDRYNAQIDRYKTMLERENLSIRDEIDIQTRLDQLEEQVGFIQRNFDSLEQRVEYSSVYLSLTEKPGTFDDLDFLGFTDSLKMFLNSLNTGLKYLVMILGFIIPFGVLYVVYRVFRRLSKKSK